MVPSFSTRARNNVTYLVNPNRKMRGSDLAEAMALAVDQIVSVREGSSTLDRAIEVVGTIGRFSGKDTTSYLEAYRVEMVMRDIPEER